MAGLAAGIRLAMYGKEVLILERHNAPGGLNSFYAIDGRRYDVGLHAVTNYVPAGVKGKPLGKLLRQLRIARDELDLCPQFGSRIAFPGLSLRFENGFSRLEQEIAEAFPGQIDGLRQLRKAVLAFDEFAPREENLGARACIAQHLSDPLLTDMLLCPLMYYGSAREHDMDFGQFVILWKAIYEEGFARPFEGVRVIIRALLKRFREVGGKRKMKCGVRRMSVQDNRVRCIELDDGTQLTADHIISTAGRVETEALLDKGNPQSSKPAAKARVGALSFVETITVLNKQPAGLGLKDTIVFFNQSERFHYENPQSPVDLRSGVVCMPNNYDYGDGRQLDEGFFRVTAIAAYDYWKSLEPEAYQTAKREWYPQVQRAALKAIGHDDSGLLQQHTLATDMFTPTTIEHFTGHAGGAVYGSPDKVQDGRTTVDNLYLAGTDQGFLGITGALLSGISMANLHVLSA
ncbi:MAG: NAD(P)/FAD-dependent oxidoreductase [Opitutales bacterium]|nr:NAD(P)/FAD-dependent oxidoreductase [Opitutales bacterium]